MLKYCEKTTSEHSISQQNPDCQCDIKLLIKNEGGSGKVFNCDKVLNLDKVEESLAKKHKRSRRSSMDVFMGVSENEQNRKAALIEFKFNVKHPKNLYKTEVEDKVNDSKGIIGTEIPIYNKYCFVFKTDVIQQAKSQFFRLFPKLNSPYQAITEKELHELYW
jgi:hypothetical protein